MDVQAYGHAALGGDTERQYLSFRVGQETYAVPTRYVREILEYGQITRVPMMPALVCGVINLRGAVVPIIDLGERFENRPVKLGPRTCIVIMEVFDEDQAQLVGALADAVSAVAEIEDDARRNAPAFGSRIRSDFIDGMARIGEGFITLLRMEQVLNLDEIADLAGRHPATSTLD